MSRSRYADLVLGVDLNSIKSGFEPKLMGGMSRQEVEAYATQLEDRIIELEQILGLASSKTNGMKFGFTYFTPVEERFLGLIYTCPRVCTKEMLFDGVWGNLTDREQPEMKVIDIYICKVRQKLDPWGVKITTMWGRGYYLDDSNRARLKQLTEEYEGKIAPNTPVLKRWKLEHESVQT